MKTPKKKPKQNQSDKPASTPSRETVQSIDAEIKANKEKLRGIEETTRVGNAALNSIAELVRLAKSQPDEFKTVALLMAATDAISALNTIARTHSELVLHVSMNAFAWPAMISRKRAIKLSNEELMDVIQLGKGVTFSQREWQLAAPSTQAAMQLFVWACNKHTWEMYKKGNEFETGLSDEAMKRRHWDTWGKFEKVLKQKPALPDLAENTKRRWFEAAWEDGIELGWKPEEDEKWKVLGKSAIGKKSISRGMAQQTEGMKRDDVRAEIKRRVWEAFDKLISGQKSR